jgi:hypothetical protein
MSRILVMSRIQRVWLHLLFGALCALALPAWSQSDPGLQGRWEGTLGGKLRLVVDFVRAADGVWFGSLTSLDQGNAVFELDDVDLQGAEIRLEVRAVRGTFRGKLNEAGTVISGVWSQGMPQPLELRKTAAPAAVPTPASPLPSRAAGPSPMGTPLVVEVLASPVPFVAGNRTHLAYEVHVTNFSGTPIELRRLDVLNGDASATEPLLRLEGRALNSALQPVGVRAPPGATDRRKIAGGSRVVGFLWLTLDSQPVPRTLQHRLATADAEFTTGRVTTRMDKPPVLGPPLKGAAWLAANGPDNSSGHRRALLPIDGHARIAQRFAIDWLKIGPGGRTFDGKAEDNRAYHAYGSEVIAVTDGEIVSIHDGIPENVPGPTSRAVPITLETVGGNYVVLGLGNDRYAFYAHLQPGSLRVKAGDRVKRGQVLGLLGNSGNSTEPHLHFHVADGPGALTSEGIPFVHDSFEVLDAEGKSSPKREELPLMNAVVDFK